MLKHSLYYYFIICHYQVLSLGQNAELDVFEVMTLKDVEQAEAVGGGSSAVRQQRLSHIFKSNTKKLGKKKYIKEEKEYDDRLEDY